MTIGSRHLKKDLTKTSQSLFPKEICRHLPQNYTKSIYGLANDVTNDILNIKIVTYNFTNDFLFATRNVKSVHYGENIFSRPKSVRCFP